MNNITSHMPTSITNKTKLVVIKGKGNSGKTTTIWLTYLELLNRGAKVLSFSGTYGGNPWTAPIVLPAANARYDFVAELLWNDKRIVLISQGDVYTYVVAELQKVLATEPDFIVCASRSQNRVNSTWELFVNKYTNLIYDRICFWSEFAQHPFDEERVKKSTVEAIIKYML